MVPDAIFLVLCKSEQTGVCDLRGTSYSAAPPIFALDGSQADGFLSLFLLLVAVRLQVIGAESSLVLLLPHPALLGLPANRGTQPLLLFLNSTESQL